MPPKKKAATSNSEFSTAILASIASKIGNEDEAALKSLPQVPESSALFVDGYEGYFDQHKQRENGAKVPIPFTRAPKIDHAMFIELMRNKPEGLLELQNSAQSTLERYKPQYQLELSHQFNLCFYGVGSKRIYINDLLNTWQSDVPIVVANGYNTATTFKDILNTCVNALLDEEITNDWLRSPSERLILFLNYLQEHQPQARLVLVVHSIDGPALKDGRSFDYLARMASSPNISLVVSVDHINAPILWSQQQMHQFGFVWHQIDTFQGYDAETAYMDILSLGKTRGAGGINAVDMVLASITKNAKSLYQVLILQQYQNMHDHKLDANALGSALYGVPHDELYNMCLERFIVSSEQNFRIMLTEFEDHKMLDKSRAKNGSVILFAPYSLDDLDQIISQHFC